MGFDANTLMAYLFGIILLYICIKVLFVPLKYMGKLIINAVVGGAALWVLNVFGGVLGIQIGINIVTALAVGLLGIPGVLLLLVLQYIK